MEPFLFCRACVLTLEKVRNPSSSQSEGVRSAEESGCQGATVFFYSGSRFHQAEHPSCLTAGHRLKDQV